MPFKARAGSTWVKPELARIRREQIQAGFAPIDIRPPCRTSADDVMPWEGLGFVMRPPPAPVNIDALPPLSKEEFTRILRRLVYDETNQRAAGTRIFPIATIAQAAGYNRVVLWRAVHSGEPSKRMVAKLSPLLRKIEAGRVKCICNGGSGKPKWEIVNVLDAPVSQ